MKFYTVKVRFTQYVLLSLSMALILVLAACQPDLVRDTAPLVEEPIDSGQAEVGEDQVVDEGDEEVLSSTTGTYAVTGLESGMMLASVMIDSNVYIQTGDEMGEIQDLLINGSTGNVLFAEVEHGGFLDIGDQEIMVPLHALTWGSHAADAFTLNVDQQAFTNWPELGEEWPVASNTNWDDAVVDFWNNQGVSIPWNPSDEMENVVWVSNLINANFGFHGGSAVANVDNVVVDLAQGQARYALISPDSALFGDEALRAVPFTALNVTVDEDEVVAIQPAMDADVIATAPPVAVSAFEGMTLFGDEWDDDLASYWADRDYLVDSGEGDQAIGNMGATGVMGADNVMMLASSILDREVDNSFDAELGEIEDLFIDGSSGNVLFATVEHGGFLDIGDEDFPVPLTAMTWNAAEEELTLPITEDLLETFPAIEDGWADSLEPGWREVTDFWRNSDFDTSMIEQANFENVVLASNLTGYGIGAYDGAGLADVRDLIIDLGNSKVQYAVISFQDTAAYGTELSIVPFTAFDPVAFGDQLVFAEDFDMNLLTDAPRLGDDVFGSLDVLDPTWDDNIAEFWDDAGYSVNPG